MTRVENLRPTILVVFGATGDLMARKITPAVCHLFEKNKLPERFKVVGFSRRQLTDESFRKHIVRILKEHGKIKAGEQASFKFQQLFSYQQGFYQRIDDYRQLARKLEQIDELWGVRSNKLFYLAVPPQLYGLIFKRLPASGLTRSSRTSEAVTRVLVEKPFGKNLKEAQNLDRLLGKILVEEQIYRIDHYLAKEMLQNILSFRFSNTLLEESWSNQFVERIEIKLLETLGVEERGSFYDGLGALRDVGQNHLLQMLALVTMDHPGTLESEAIRRRRRELLEGLKALSESEVIAGSFRAQYQGYRRIVGVKPQSETETYFRVGFELNSPRWYGVPVTLESGKRLAQQCKEVVVSFKHPMPCLCPKGAGHYQNKVIFRLEPKEGIEIRFWSKKPGLDFEVQGQKLDFLLRKTKGSSQYVEEYEKLLLDCITGDQTLFLSTAEVKSMWRFVDPIVETWQRNLVPLKTYLPGTAQVIDESSSLESDTVAERKMAKKVGVVGLGKMGKNIARRLIEKGWQVVGFNRTESVTRELEKEGVSGVYSLKELVQRLMPPRVVWLMLTAGQAVEEVIFGKRGLASLLDKGDVIVDAANSFYQDSIRREKRLKKLGIDLVDVGVSGGPSGARNGACLMVGGKQRVYEYLFPLFRDLAIKQGVQFFKGAGGGHFVKMVHNGIEYGMMQAIGEGFALMCRSRFKPRLQRVADLYNHGSVVESRLIGWLEKAYAEAGQNLSEISGSVAHSGEGLWTVEEAKRLGIPVPVIEAALNFRIKSQKKPSYTGKVVSALRGQFGGHEVKKQQS